MTVQLREHEFGVRQSLPLCYLAVRLVVVIFTISFVACQQREERPPAPPRPKPAAPQFDETKWKDEIRAWQERRAKNLKKEDSWLTLVALDWLDEGENSVGSAEGSKVKLPPSTPPKVATIVKQGEKVTIQAQPGSGLQSDGKDVTTLELKPDTSGEPTTLKVGTVSFYLIERGGKLGIRAKDSAHPARAQFKSLDYYPVDSKWRVTGRFEKYDPPKQVPIVNIIGITEPMPSPGAFVFTIDGNEYRLEPVLEEGSDELFFIFGDETNGKETYGAGRYLYTPMPTDGTLVVDFNKAYNPPCAFTPYATCPLPPKQNKLPLAITAGEKNYGEH